MQADTMPFLAGDQPKDRDRLRFSLDQERWELLPGEVIHGRLANILIHQNLTQRGVLHETGSHIDSITYCAVGTAIYTTTGTSSRETLTDTNLNFTDEIHLQITQFQRSCNPADGIVLMCERRAKRDVEIATFVTDRQLDHIAIVASQDALHCLNISIKFGFSLGVAVIVNTREAQE